MKTVIVKKNVPNIVAKVSDNKKPLSNKTSIILNKAKDIPPTIMTSNATNNAINNATNASNQMFSKAGNIRNVSNILNVSDKHESSVNKTSNVVNKMKKLGIKKKKSNKPKSKFKYNKKQRMKMMHLFNTEFTVDNTSTNLETSSLGGFGTVLTAYNEKIETSDKPQQTSNNIENIQKINDNKANLEPKTFKPPKLGSKLPNKQPNISNFQKSNEYKVNFEVKTFKPPKLGLKLPKKPNISAIKSNNNNNNNNNNQQKKSDKLAAFDQFLNTTFDNAGVVSLTKKSKKTKKNSKGKFKKVTPIFGTKKSKTLPPKSSNNIINNAGTINANNTSNNNNNNNNSNYNNNNNDNNSNDNIEQNCKTINNSYNNSNNKYDSKTDPFTTPVSNKPKMVDVTELHKAFMDGIESDPNLEYTEVPNNNNNNQLPRNESTKPWNNIKYRSSYPSTPHFIGASKMDVRSDPINKNKERRLKTELGYV